MYKLKPIEWKNVATYSEKKRWLTAGDIGVFIEFRAGNYTVVDSLDDRIAGPFATFAEAERAANKDILNELLPYLEPVADTGELARLRAAHGHLQQELSMLRSREMHIDDIADYTESIQRLKAENEQLKQTVEALGNEANQPLANGDNQC